MALRLETLLQWPDQPLTSHDGMKSDVTSMPTAMMPQSNIERVMAPDDAGMPCAIQTLAPHDFIHNPSAFPELWRYGDS
eukprot:2492088-Heterocapsa_arctica.AAC.1